jgi:hypothetical protein
MDQPPNDPRSDPASGWTLGAGGLPKAAWLVLAVLLIALGAVLLGVGYLGYGILIVIVGLAAGVNLL